jgi:hypothetical protein
MEGWGWTVTLIDDDDTQANFDSAAAVNKVAYISQEALATSVGAKLTNNDIGVVNENKDMVDDFGFATGVSMGGGLPTMKVDFSHYITSVFAANPVSPYAANDWYQIVNEPVATGVDPVGTWVEAPWEGKPALMALCPGGSLIGGGTAAGRRVQLPWGSGQGATPVDINNSISDDGRTMTQRAIKWAAGVGECGGGGGGGGGNPNFADDFETDDYTGSTGTQSWAGDWIEVNENGNPGNGDEVVDVDNGDYAVRVRDNDSGGEGVERAADLSAYSSATLSFEYRREGLDDADDNVRLMVSGNGGGEWTEVDRFEGPADDADYTPVSYDITSFIGTDTRIRFISSPTLGPADAVWFDNVNIECTP